MKLTSTFAGNKYTFTASKKYTITSNGNKLLDTENKAEAEEYCRQSLARWKDATLPGNAAKSIRQFFQHVIIELR